LRGQVCLMIGMLRLTTPSALNTVIRGLGDKDAEVREHAANAVHLLGADARAAVPALTTLLESGKAAEGTIEAYMGFRPIHGNMALMCLGAVGPDARPAVPVIQRRFAKASEDEKLDFFHCIASIGPAAKECVGLLRSEMQGDKAEFRLMAACALLNVVPDDQAAAAIVIDGLASKDKLVRGRPLRFWFRTPRTLRAQALETCVVIGPRSKAIVPVLQTLLEDEVEDTRNNSALALGHVGPDAAAAIPALEKLLIKKDDHRNHTFVSHAAAGHALWRIGKASLPALLRATDKESSGRQYAISALGGFGRDAQPAAVERLANIVADKNDTERWAAAIALGQLGEHARSARRALEAARAKLDDNSSELLMMMPLMIDWALMEIAE
jgi:HEAT repeat protein